MSIEWVLDASVLAKCVFEEENTDHARYLVTSAVRVLAPDFIFIELASIAAKKVRRGQDNVVFAAGALQRASHMIVEVEPASGLAVQAFQLASEHGVSVYDGLYLALAIERDLAVLTADARLVGRSGRAGLGRYVQLLSSA